jgi:hypothetical protein
MVSTAPENNEIPSTFKIVYQVPFKTMYLNESTSTIITIWNLNSAEISDEEYKKDAEDTVQLIRDSKAHNMISDHRENKFNISPDLQKWYADLIAKVLGHSSFERCAVIITSDLNLLSALEEIRTNLTDLGDQVKISYRFFADYKEAEKWIHGKGV